MSALAYDDDIGAFDITADRLGRLPIGNDITDAVLISLFSDQRADADVDLPSADADRRGWWSDSYTSGGRIGSLLWLVSREKSQPAIAQQIEQHARAALQWLLDDNVVDAVAVQTRWLSNTALALEIDIAAAEQPEADVDERQTIGGLDVDLTVRLHSRAHAVVRRFPGVIING